MERSGHHAPGSPVGGGLTLSSSDMWDVEQPKVKMVVLGDADVGKSTLLITYTTPGGGSSKVNVGGSNPLSLSSSALNSNNNVVKPRQLFADFNTTIRIDDKDFDLSLWDTDASKEYEHIRPLNYAHTDLFLLCYSVGCPTSLENVKEVWDREVRAHFEKGGKKAELPLRMLVGLKSDLRDNPLTCSGLDVGELERQGGGGGGGVVIGSVGDGGGVIVGGGIKERKRLTTREEAARIAREIGAVDSLECSAATGEGVDELFTEAANLVLYPQLRPNHVSNSNTNPLIGDGAAMLHRRVSLSNANTSEDEESVDQINTNGGGGKKKRRGRNGGGGNRKSKKEKCIIA